MEAARIHHSLTQLTVFSWFVQRKKRLAFCKSFFGSGRRIRTLTNRVRVCRATLTQSRYFFVLPCGLFHCHKDRCYYTKLSTIVNRFFKIFFSRLISSFFHCFVLFPHFIASLFVDIIYNKNSLWISSKNSSAFFFFSNITLQSFERSETYSMQQLSRKQQLLVGFTLFSMFFGAGNLIFLPQLGAWPEYKLGPPWPVWPSAPSACPFWA